MVRVDEQVYLIAARPGDADRLVAGEPDARSAERVGVVAGEAPPVEVADRAVVVFVARGDVGDQHPPRPLVVGLALHLPRNNAHRSHVRTPPCPATITTCVSPTKRPCSTTPGSALIVAASATGSGIGPKAQS